VSKERTKGQESRPEIKKDQEELSEELLEIEEELTSLNPEIFKGLPPKKKMEILKSFSIVSIQQKSHSGPLPDPDTLVKYNSIIPNGADRIMKMAENQQAHRIRIETKVVHSQSFQSYLGQIFGLVIGLFGIGCGTYLATTGETVVGGIIAGGTVVSLVSVFVIGKAAQRK
jgi:uncharacterized membrane protein